MFKTGNSFTDVLLLGISFLPLLPAVLIFIRRLYGLEPFNFLALICLLCFLRGLISLIYPLSRENQYFTNKVFALLLFLLFALTFRSGLGGKLRYGLTLLLTSLVSVVFTYWSLTGWGVASPGIGMLLNGSLAVLIAISVSVVFHNDELGVFRSPVFWMGGGTLFYLLLSLLLEGIGIGGNPLTGPADPEKRLFLGLAELVQYLSFTIAVFSFHREGEEAGGL